MQTNLVEILGLGLATEGPSYTKASRNLVIVGRTVRFSSANRTILDVEYIVSIVT